MKAEGGRKWPDSVTVSHGTGHGGGRGGVGEPTFDVIQLAPNELEMVSHLQCGLGGGTIEPLAGPPLLS